MEETSAEPRHSQDPEPKGPARWWFLSQCPWSLRAHVPAGPLAFPLAPSPLVGQEGGRDIKSAVPCNLRGLFLLQGMTPRTFPSWGTAWSMGCSTWGSGNCGSCFRLLRPAVLHCAALPAGGSLVSPHVGSAQNALLHQPGGSQPCLLAVLF